MYTGEFFSNQIWLIKTNLGCILPNLPHDQVLLSSLPHSKEMSVMGHLIISSAQYCLG